MKPCWHTDGVAEEQKAKEHIMRISPHLVFKFQRLNTPFGEVDLVFYNKEKNQLFIYEVKKWNGKTPPDQRINEKQISRLKKVCFYLSEKYQKNISLELILVHKDQITQMPL